MTESLESLQRSFNRALRVEGKADRTLVIYGQSVRYLARWLVENDQRADLDNLTRENVLAWFESLRGRGLTDGTIKTRWRGLRRFTGWLVAEGIVDKDPLVGIKVKNPVPPPVPVLDDADLKKLIAACKGTHFRDRRDMAMVRLLLDCGLRVSELTGITLDDLDLDAETVVVTGKGSRVRAAYFGAKTGQALDRYLRERSKHRHASLGALFLGERGPFSTDGVRERLQVRAQMAGIDGRMNPHRFRHTNAHDFLLAGGQERDLKRLMGWRSDAMLDRYGASGADIRARESVKRLRRGDRV
ncbi:tyrosine-type recombinase/integrase [Rhodococcus sp. T7]|uniref:tyrosine-type recombinase/integrase n=1 Tax=Rhodococcus sp. T7 TaxID=627444 RepID=UPI001356B090|nr:tyrosine-type recombinase/integrase [Rhodococcus sp. T7]KAF0958457.1 Tyrosine recombinase XerC [Rhodococcus sp. T7]